jgi:hypothetical protein
MDEVGLGLSDLREAIPRMRRLRRDDAAPIRMTFPCHVAIRLRSGGLLETDGRERGGSGAPLDEQLEVVGEKFGIASDAAEMPKAWRRRPRDPNPAAS